MNKNNKETSIVVKPAYQPHISIDKNIHEALTLYALTLYMTLRYEADFRKDDAEVKRSAKFLYTRAKISRAQYYRCLNELESFGLILRDPENKLGDKCVFHVARELNYFLRGVSEIDRGVSQRDTDQESLSLSNINITTSDNSKISCQDVVDAYHEVLPDNPKIKVIGSDLTKQIKSMIKNWSKYNKDKKTFSLSHFKEFLEYIKKNYRWFIEPYPTESGKIKQNNLTNITRERNIVRIINGEFSAT